MKKPFQLFAPAAIALVICSNALAIDINAGPIWTNEDAKTKCHRVCSDLKWNGQWKTTHKGVMSVCGTTYNVDIPIGLIGSNEDAKVKCPTQLSKVTWNGNWKTTVPGQMSVCGCNPPQPVK